MRVDDDLDLGREPAAWSTGPKHARPPMAWKGL